VSDLETALRYMNFVKGEAPRTADPAFTFACWDELAELVDTERFVRVSRHGEAMDWTEAVALMQGVVGVPKHYTLRAATETGDRVILEMAERTTRDGAPYPFDSVYIFSFDPAGRITRLEVYRH
jgi:hypothetical protein